MDPTLSCLALRLEPSLCSADSIPLALPLPFTNWETEVRRSPEVQGRRLLAAGAGLPSAGLPGNGPLHQAQPPPGGTLPQACGCTDPKRPHTEATVTCTHREESSPSQGRSPQPPQTPACLACTERFSGSLLPLAEPRATSPHGAQPGPPCRGHQAAHSQGAQGTLTGEGQPPCCPSRPPRCRWGCPQSGRKASFFEPLETCPPLHRWDHVRGCAPRLWVTVPSSPGAPRALGSGSQGQMKFCRQAARGGDLVGATSQHPRGPRARAGVDLGAPLREDYFRGRGAAPRLGAPGKAPWD